MGWNYSIMSPADAYEPSPSRPPTAIGTFRSIHDWIKRTHANGNPTRRA